MTIGIFPVESVTTINSTLAFSPRYLSRDRCVGSPKRGSCPGWGPEISSERSIFNPYGRNWLSFVLSTLRRRSWFRRSRHPLGNQKRDQVVGLQLLERLRPVTGYGGWPTHRNRSMEIPGVKGVDLYPLYYGRSFSTPPICSIVYFFPHKRNKKECAGGSKTYKIEGQVFIRTTDTGSFRTCL